MHKKVLSHYIKSFNQAIHIEMEALKNEQGSFEVEIYDLRNVSKVKTHSTSYEYSLKIKSYHPKVLENTECDLKCNGIDFMIRIIKVEKKKVIIQSQIKISLNAEQYHLVFYPWFLYQRLIKSLESLLKEDHYHIESALSLFGEIEAVYQKNKVVYSHENLNASQYKAVEHCLENNISFVWGPPGTGKTSTLIHILEEFLYRNFRVLILSTTHAALQQALDKLYKKKELNKLFEEGRVLRYGHVEEDCHGTRPREIYMRLNEGVVTKIKSIESKIKDYCNLLKKCDFLLTSKKENEQPKLSFDLFSDVEFDSFNNIELEQVYHRKHVRSIEKLSYQKQRAHILNKKKRLKQCLKLAEQLKNDLSEKYQYNEAEIIENASIIFSTLTHAYMNSEMSHEHFDAVIVDEAGMALLPLLFYSACLSDKKVIMIGDPKQLPSITHSKSSMVYQWMGRNIFDYSIENPYHSDKVVLLDTQHRMHFDIAEVVSDVFYDGNLKTSEAVNHLEIVKQAPFEGDAVVVFDTESKFECKVEESGRSRYNEDSANLCVKFANDALKGNGYHCAIITPYAAQARLIRNLLKQSRAHFDRIECSTVHKFQGKECDIIILDTVDSDPYKPGVLLASHGLGSVSDKLLNVSLSRAKGKLILVCDVDYYLDKDSKCSLSKVLKETVQYRKTIESIA